MFYGTTIEATVNRVVDGDTLRVQLNGKEEVLRIQALDTEESNAGGTKPVTPHGRAAKKAATEFFPKNSKVTLEFAGTEPLEICLEKYRDNFGRLLVFIHKDDKDFQEYMIETGYSPYFVKYGYVSIPEYHDRYTKAECKAQAESAGLWDQIRVNNSEINNYALLTTWWHLRAKVIDEYRLFKEKMPEILNTRLDYATLIEKAEAEQTAIVFTELRTYQRTRGNHLIIDIGSRQQPFQVFVPEVDSDAGQDILRLLLNRYIPGDTVHPRRGYAYVEGPLNLYQNRENFPPIVQLKVTKIDQIRDRP
jgi:micrococcal nuclease